MKGRPLILALALVLAGCAVPLEEQTRIKDDTYRGHKYIVFGEGADRNVVHDPDCACLEATK